MKKFLILFLIPALVSICEEPAYSLTDDEKNQKRLELQNHFDEAFSKDIVKVAEEARPLRLTGNASMRLGHDNNVDLANDEDDDLFYRHRIAGKVEYDVPNLEIAGNPFTIGSDMDYYYHSFFDRDDVNRQGGKIAPFIDLELIPDFDLVGSYGIRFLDYDEQEDLNYLAQSGRLRLTHRWVANLKHYAEVKYEELQYDDRKKVNALGAFTNIDREDERYVFAYQVNHTMGQIRWRLKGSWMFNDSNDEFLEYNDYEDFGLNASASWRTLERWVFTGFGGWHAREYDNRSLLNTTITQSDNWYYLGGRIFFLVNTWSGVDVTFTYNENDSNDSDHEYKRIVASAGYHLFF